MAAKSTILIIGQNIERQIIDLDQTITVTDEQQRSWLDVCFDDRVLLAYRISRQFSQLSSLEQVLRLLNYQLLVPSLSRNFVTQIVLKVGHGHKIIRSRGFDDYLWERPAVIPKAVVLLESANLSAAALADLKEYLTAHPSVKLIVEYDSILQQTAAGRWLVARAELLWVDLVWQQAVMRDEVFLNQIELQQQLLLINHASGLSLSDQQRTYKLTNADCLKLKALEWLAIAIKALDYQFDIEDRLGLIANIGRSLADNQRINIGQAADQASRRHPQIELLRGMPDRDKTVLNLVRDVQRSTGLVLDLSNQSTVVTRQLLAVRDLPNQAGLVMIDERQYFDLMKYQFKTATNLTQKIPVAVELTTQKRNLTGCEREAVVEIADLDAKLNRLEFHQIKLARLRVDFLVGQTMPSERIILANVRQLAEFAKRCLSRAMVPIVEIELCAQSSFDDRPGSVALELVRILRCLKTELRMRKVQSGQLLIQVKLPEPLGCQLNLATFLQWTTAIEQQINKRQIGFDHLKFAVNLPTRQFNQWRRQGVDLMCCEANLKELLNRPLTDQALRIAFSQFLVN